jgi:hypothetical protein
MKQKEPDMHLPLHVQEKFEEEIRAEIIRQQTEEELKNNTLYQSFFNQFNPTSVESFIRNYARRKAIYMTRGHEYMNSNEQSELKYKLLAEESLWAIQQKKLFNLQCDWRAEKIKLKGLEHSTQFTLFSANIQLCPFISPISRAEVELYISYLKSGYAKPLFGFDNWQDYEAFKAEAESGSIPGIDSELGEHMPRWFQYFDEHMGTSHLLMQDDVRGRKENKYRSIARQKQLEDIRSKSKTEKQSTESRPYLSIFDLEQVENFVRKFEDRKVLDLYRAVEHFQQMLDDHMEVDEALETLKSAKTKVATKSNQDWKASIIEAAMNYEMSQIASCLPAVFQEYQFRAENGINFPQRMIDKKKEEYAFQMCEIAKQQILEGRSMYGEDESLNF